jgi:hypothetical protein
MKDKENRVRNPRKGRIFLAAVLLLIAATAAGGTLAWLIDSSDEVTNNFVVPEVPPTIVEGWDGTTKSNVAVKNDVGADKGIDVYIRVALVPTWETGGNVAPIPASLDDLNMTWHPNSNGWFTHGDYYYYASKVAPGDSTSVLIESATVERNSAGAKAGYSMNLQVLAEAIQATQTAVEATWGEAVWTQLNH